MRFSDRRLAVLWLLAALAQLRHVNQAGGIVSAVLGVLCLAMAVWWWRGNPRRRT
jgi:hypothetical protein